MNTLAQLTQDKTILLTSYRRDGTPVATPVSLAFDGDRAFFRTWHTAWKARRLARNPNVEVAPATLRGKPTGPAVPARARLLEGDERTDWWQHAVDTWPTYASYQKKTERQIPVVVLEPV